jgi:hypothetical protein
MLPHATGAGLHLSPAPRFTGWGSLLAPGPCSFVRRGKLDGYSGRASTLSATQMLCAKTLQRTSSICPRIALWSVGRFQTCPYSPKCLEDEFSEVLVDVLW